MICPVDTYAPIKAQKPIIAAQPLRRSARNGLEIASSCFEFFIRERRRRPASFRAVKNYNRNITECDYVVNRRQVVYI